MANVTLFKSEKHGWLSHMSAYIHRCILVAFIFLSLTCRGFAVDVDFCNNESSVNYYYYFWNSSVTLQHKWTYRIFKSDLWADQYIKLNPSGMLSLGQFPFNYEQPNKPVYVLATNSYKAMSIIPVNFNFHSPDCVNSSDTSVPNIEDNKHIVIINLENPDCFHKSHVLFSLEDYVPTQFQNCIIKHRRLQSSGNLIVDSNSNVGQVIVMDDICIGNNDHIFITVETSITDCDVQQVIFFEVILQTADLFIKPLITSENRNFYKRRLKRDAVTNPSAPTFSQALYIKRVLEEQDAPVHVATITANDPDPGVAGQLTYSMLTTREGRSQELFSIDPMSGRIITKQKLDREDISIHYFQVEARDNGNPPRIGQASLTIYVLDVNDFTPKFELSSYAIPLPENTPVGSTVLTVRATDQDSGSNAEIRYSILKQNADEAFSINPHTGSITTKAPLDREKFDEYVLKVQAEDQGPPTNRKAAVVDVKIAISDDNDNHPQFTQKSYSVNVKEDIDSLNQPTILTVSAVDPDLAENARIKYSIVSGNSGDTFEINEANGKISVLHDLDYEKQNGRVYRLHIRAQDGGQPPRTNSTTVTVNVIDVNDNSPRFYTAQFTESVLESINPGFSILHLQAYDLDSGSNSELVYSVKDAPSDMPITVDSRTGWLSTSGRLDREKAAKYHFNVEAKDGGNPPRSASASVVINVLDVNDNSPVFSHREYSVAVSEEAKIGTPVKVVIAKDADSIENARVTYSITGGNMKNVFSIRSNIGQGIISLAQTLDYKDQNRFVLSVAATDPGGKTDTCTVIVNVTDANTYRPRFRGTPYVVPVKEDVPVGASIFKVLADDDDVGENARITYSISDDTKFFQIDPNSGVISTKEQLDREKEPIFTLTVTASDNGIPSKSDATDVFINVVDVNDNAPIFNQPSYLAEINEKVPIGTSVLKISATDKDTAANGQIQYTFDGGDDGNGDFRLDSTFGVVRTAKLLDRESTPLYHLKAFAVDMGQLSKSTSVTITVKILDANDNSPQFDSSSIDLVISENSPIGSKVGIIKARDPDEGENAVVRYVLVDQEVPSPFSLTTTSDGAAKIISNVNLDYESGRTEYVLTLQAYSGTLLNKIQVHIKVKDINDNKPVLQDFKIIFNNYLDHFPSGIIGYVPAFDPDVSDKLLYDFISGNEANVLHLNRTTGALKLNYRLNSDVPKLGELKVRVSDGLNNVTAICELSTRMITLKYLYNSLTIRLNKMLEKAFLSNLYGKLLDGLQYVLNVARKDIIILDIHQDNVKGQVLNVSFCVQNGLEDKNGDKLFYSIQYLQEQVYLHREKLSAISTVEILPFRDNIWCVLEPCLNFKDCVDIYRFGAATPFISSSTMLFRPIHPVKSYDCPCPNGFTGMKAMEDCDTEVNLCYSKPCGGNGTCVQIEGGYTCVCEPGVTGKNCEIDMVHKKYDKSSCPSHACKGDSQCVPLIKGGFRCENCLNKAFNNKYCQLTTRTFIKSSFLMFPSLKKRYRFTIRLKFASVEKDGLLLYNGRLYQELFDFIALVLRDGQVEFHFSLGDKNITKVTTYIPEGVNNGDWQEIYLEYFNRTVSLTVGDGCDKGVTVMYGQQAGSENRCASTVTKVLDDICAGSSEMCFRLFDVNGPLHIGGVPSFSRDPRLHIHAFVGCLKDLHIDEKLLDFNDFVAEEATSKGCYQKQNYCGVEKCKNGGKCVNTWGTFRCICPKNYDGKDCSLSVSLVMRLTGDSYIELRQPGVPPIQRTWFNGISFRTNQPSGLLLYIELGQNKQVTVELLDGGIRYSFDKYVALFDSILLNDGDWHHLETKWSTTSFVFTIDYGKIVKSTPMSGNIDGLTVGTIYVGGQPQPVTGGIQVIKGFKGCVQNVNVGNSAASFLSLPTSGYNTLSNCNAANPCKNNPCPANSQCTNKFEEHRCECFRGYFGPKCVDICKKYNPCKHGSTCRNYPSSSDGYICECSQYHTGQYCEHVIGQPCPKGWFGNPICGPCDCPSTDGLAPSCNKSSGECLCSSNHYLPPGTNECRPCDCYTLGSRSRACNRRSGQCICKEGVTGRQCDRCYSHYGEVTLKGCKIIYNQCPRSWVEKILWQRTNFSSTAVLPCPRLASGVASRYCSENKGWHKPNMFDCVSLNFLNLKNELMKLETGMLRLTSFLAIKRAKQLRKAHEDTSELYGSDIDITYRLIKEILLYENGLSGLELTHTQDKKFIENMLYSMDRIFDQKFEKVWDLIQNRSAGSEELMQLMEQYSHNLAVNMAPTLFPAFDIVTDKIVLGVDIIAKKIGNETRIPKYNNKPRNPKIFDNYTTVVIPRSVYDLKSVRGAAGVKSDDATVGYVMYKTLGNILPKSYDSNSVRVKRKMAVNAPIFTLNLMDRNHTISGELSKLITLRFKQLQLKNRSSPQCVYWDHGDDSADNFGKWSSRGCQLVERSADTDSAYVTCQCNHLTTFSVLMDVSDVEYEKVEPVRIEIITYIGLSLSCSFLLASSLILCCLRRLHSNSNNIHVNLMLCIFIAEAVYLLGIDHVEPQLLCKVTAIVLHYFFMCAFAWMFVESLHLYRMLSEIRDVNSGSMKFYYAVGYVVPGIIVGLAVGLHTDGYGNPKFCWLSTSDGIIWSFVGPVCIVYVMNVVVFFMAVKASCDVKSQEDLYLLRIGLVAAMFLLPLLGIAWVFGLMSVNDEVLAFHYMFAIFSFLQGLFLMLGHVALNPRVRYEILRCFRHCRGEKDDEESVGNTHTSYLSTGKQRSALAYHNNTPNEGLKCVSVGISTTSTTSRSTDQTSSGGGYYGTKLARNESTSTSGNPASASDFTTIPSRGNESSIFHDKSIRIDDPDTGEVSRRQRRDSDSDSDVSVGRASLELASSHSSDDDEDDDTRWDRIIAVPQNKVIDRVKGQTKLQQKIPPKHSTPLSVSNLPYDSSQWVGDAFSASTTSNSSAVMRDIDPVKVIERQGNHDLTVYPAMRGTPTIGLDSGGSTPIRSITPSQHDTSNDRIPSPPIIPTGQWGVASVVRGSKDYLPAQKSKISNRTYDSEPPQRVEISRSPNATRHRASPPSYGGQKRSDHSRSPLKAKAINSNNSEPGQKVHLSRIPGSSPPPYAPPAYGMERASPSSTVSYQEQPSRVAVQVLTHNGSISSDDDSIETCV